MATKRARNEANPIETLGAGLSQAFGKDLAAEGGKDFLRQLLGVSFGSSEGAPTEPTATGKIINGELIFNSENHKTTKTELVKKSEKAETRIEAAIDYRREVIHTERFAKQEHLEMDRKIEQILTELQRLIKSSRELQGTFKDVAMEQRPVESGKYYETFWEWVLITIRTARQKVDDSRSWLNVSKSKHKKGSFGDISRGGKNQSVHQSGERTTIQNSAG